MPALLPCPFCGSRNIEFMVIAPPSSKWIIEHKRDMCGDVVGVQCLDCFAKIEDTPWQSIVDTWNKRAKQGEAVKTSHNTRSTKFARLVEYIDRERNSMTGEVLLPDDVWRKLRAGA